MAARRSSRCALCDGAGLPSFCAACVNLRLGEYHARLRAMRTLCDALNSRIAGRVDAKRKADEQRSWGVSKAQDIEKLKDRLNCLTEQIALEKTKVEQASSDLKSRTVSLNLANDMLKRKRAEWSLMHMSAMKTVQMSLMAITSERLKRQSKAIKQVCRLFPMHRVNIDGGKKGGYNGPCDVICGARLPRGLDPHSVPSEELSASLGYMLLVLNISVPILSAPTLHISGFGGSCSRIWQRSSYWSTRQSQSKVYPLFMPRQNFCSVGEENSWSDSGSGNFGVDPVNSDKKQLIDSKRSNSFNFSAASSHSMERHYDLQKGISLLKTSVTLITAYCYNSLGLDVPSDLSTFEAFAKLLHVLSSSKALQSALELNVASRSEKQAQQLSRSIWKVNSGNSSDSCLIDSAHAAIMPSSPDDLPTNSTTSFMYTGNPAKHGGAPESILEGWNMVEREILPPPPSQVEDIAQWERAMFAGARKK